MRAVSRQPSGPGDRINDEWKRAVKAELERRGWTQEHLAELVGTTSGGISGVLKTSEEVKPPKKPVRRSRFGAAIARATGIPLPVETDDAAVAEYVRLARQIRDHDPDFFAAELEHLRRVVALHLKAAVSPGGKPAPQDVADVEQAAQGARRRRR